MTAIPSTKIMKIGTTERIAIEKASQKIKSYLCFGEPLTNGEGVAGMAWLEWPHPLLHASGIVDPFPFP